MRNSHVHIDTDTSVAQDLLEELRCFSTPKAPLRIPAGIDMRLPLKRGRKAVWENQRIRKQNENRKPFGDFDHRFAEACTRRVQRDMVAYEWYADTLGSADGSYDPEDEMIARIDGTHREIAEEAEADADFEAERQMMREADEKAEEELKASFRLETPEYYGDGDVLRRLALQVPGTDEETILRVRKRRTKHVHYGKPPRGWLAFVTERIRRNSPDWPHYWCLRNAQRELRQAYRYVTWTYAYAPEHPVPEVRGAKEREETRDLHRARRMARNEGRYDWGGCGDSRHNYGRKPKRRDRASLRFVRTDVVNGRRIQRLIAQAEIDDGNAGALLLLREIINEIRAEVRAERDARRQAAMNVAA